MMREQKYGFFQQVVSPELNCGIFNILFSEKLRLAYSKTLKDGS